MPIMHTLIDESEAIFISPEEEGLRIDKILANRFPDYSRTYFQTLIDEGFVLLNGELIKKRICPDEGDEVEICFQALEGPSLKAESIPLDILYEDDHILAINKPPGMVVHPAPGHWSGTFVNALLAHCEKLAPSSDPLRPGIVHRLDKDTSGVLIAAKTLLAHQKLIEDFSLRRMEKTYLAICHGKPPNGVVNAPIGRHPVHRKEMAIIPDGKEAITSIQTLACNAHFSLVLARPKTGRTHQIRVHLKHLRCPVLGDPIYGNPSGEAPARLLLHAYRLEFKHPITKLPLCLSAPIPEDFKPWLYKLCGPTLCTTFV